MGKYHFLFAWIGLPFFRAGHKTLSLCTICHVDEGEAYIRQSVDRPVSEYRQSLSQVKLSLHLEGIDMKIMQHFYIDYKHICIYVYISAQVWGNGKALLKSKSETIN